MPYGRLLFLGAALMPACGYQKHVDGSSNGNAGVLSFATVDGRGLDAPCALGAPRSVEVRRMPGGEVTCRPLGGKSVSIQGGGIPNCEGAPVDPVAVESASCDDEACEITTAETPSGAVVRVTGKRAGRVRVNVSVRSRAVGKSYQDSVDLEFAVAERLRLSGTPLQLESLRVPLLPGFTFEPPTATVVDASDRRLEFDGVDPTPTLGGSSLRSNDGSTFSAVSAGRTTVRWEVPGVVKRALDVEVVSPEMAQSVVVFAREDVSVRDSDEPFDFDDPVPKSPAPIATVDLTTGTFGATFPTRVRLRDGRAALAKVTSAEVVPADFAKVHTMRRPDAINFETPRAVGSGSLVVYAGEISSTLPLRVTAAD